MNVQTLPEILRKVSSLGIGSLFELVGQSFAEIRRRVNKVLTYKETRLLHTAVQQQILENRLYEARLFTRANPQLKNFVRLAMSSPTIAQRDYDSMFGGRSSYFVAPGTVSSMFSPAAYLTELYREAKALRAASSVYHLEQRRPDLQALVLDQHNLDQTLSVLDLSNELLMEGAKLDLATDHLGVLTALSTWRHSGMTPHHAAFERVRQAVLAKNGVDWPVSAAPEVMGLISSASLQGINSGFSPELYAILSEAITDQNIAELYTRNFGTMSAQALMDMQALSKYYDVGYEPLQYFAGVYSSQHDYPNNQYSYADIDSSGDITLRHVMRTYPTNSTYFNSVTLLHVANERYELRFNFAQVSASAPLSIAQNGDVIFTDAEFSAQVGIDYRVMVTISDVQLASTQLFEFIFSDATASAQFELSEQAPERFLLEINKWVRLHKTTDLEPIALERAVRSSIPYPVGKINTYTSGDQGSNFVIALADGGWLALWNSDGQDGSNYGVYQKRYSSAGEPLSGDVLVNTTTSGHQYRPNAALLAGGGWVVCWENDSGNIFQQRYNAEGVRIGTESVVTPSNHASINTQATGLADGGWVVAWQATVDAGSDFDIYQLRFDRVGVAVGQPTRVNTTTVDKQEIQFSRSSIITLVDGGWVIAWTSNLQDGANLGVYFQRYDANGNPVSTETRANAVTADSQFTPWLAACRDGGWLIVWTSNLQDGSASGVYQRRFDSAGAPLGDESLVNTSTSGDQNTPTICTLNDGGWVVAWQGAGSAYDVFQQRFDASGAKVGGEVRVNTYTSNDQKYPCACSLVGGGWVVNYSSSGQDGSGWGCYQQRYNVNGQVASDVTWEINFSTLRRVADMQLYVQRYGIEYEKALILCNANISEHPFGNEPSQFDRLFNTPPLNGFVFTADGTNIDLNPGSTGDDPRKAVLARAFHADEVSLYRLLHIVDGSDADGIIPNDIAHLSDLYLASLLAEVHGLSIDELAWLLMALGEESTQLSGISDVELRQLILRLHAAVRSLEVQKWSPYHLFVMTTTEYAITLTPEIQNLIDTINGALHGSTLTDAALIDAMAPQVAALLRLSSHAAANSLLTWIDQLTPGGLDVDAFWADIQGDVPTPAAIQFCHALAQLALVFQATGLDERSLAVLVTTPAKLITLPAGVMNAPHDARTLLQLGSYMGWVHRLGGDAATALSALNAGALTPAMVATSMGKDPHLLAQAAEQALAHGQIAAVNVLSSWPEIEIVLQWVHLSAGLGVAPQALSDWLALDYLNQVPPVLAYGDWDKVATSLTAGVATDKVAAFEGGLREALSVALVAYYLREIADPVLGLSSRDDLYGYLLLDNQVSSVVMTTRIAEAIASVQLYINRALDGIEPEVDSAVVSRPFFVDWSRYHKRYSTWAGVSQLVYYPENYIDPTVRQGQTNLLDALLQTLNQSQLADETIEGAFSDYLTDFEQVADLKVLSGYHDHTDILQGMSYLVGNRRGNAQDYYWRSLNHDLAQNGTFPANAWRDWSRIDCGINPHQQVIRPVVRNGRLHLVWLERIEQADDSSGSVVSSYAHVLKLVQQHYDGTWSAPQSYPADDFMTAIEIPETEVPGLYCAEDPSTQSIVVILYRRQADVLSTLVAGLSVGVDLIDSDLTTEEANAYRNSAYFQMDTDTLRRINNRFMVIATEYTYEVPTSVDYATSWSPGDKIVSGIAITQLWYGNIRNISMSGPEEQRNVTMSPMVRAMYTVSGDDGSVKSGYAINQYQNLIIYNSAGSKMNFPTFNNGGEVVSEGLIWDHSVPTAKTLGFTALAGSNTPATMEVWDNVGGYYTAQPVVDSYSYISHVTQGIDGSIIRFKLNVLGQIDDVHFDFNDAVIDTNIVSANVRVIVRTSQGSDEQEFRGDSYVAAPPPQSFNDMEFYFNPVTFDGSNLTYDSNDTAKIEVEFEAKFASTELVGREIFHILVQRRLVVNDELRAMTLLDDANLAQYLQWGPYRTRLNTTFAHQLVARAAKGLESILTLASQQLPEPQLGHGGYINVTLPAYDSTMHGTERIVKLELFDGSAPIDRQAYFSFAGVTLSDAPQTLTLFVPVSQQALGYPVDFPVTVGSGLEVHLNCTSGRFKTGVLNLDAATLAPTSFVNDAAWNAARDPVVVVMPTYVEPMDFTGANALYFWELFYYTPMLIAQRLMLEQQFDGAQRWLEYVWKPSGYLVNGVLQSYYWNVRPLLEDTSWNSVPLDSTDPDAVAQQDPMHYKLCTFMRTLDLLLARGDAAYRKLERDSLSEAKMWYTQALHLLGDEPYLPLGGGWSEPSLGDAADETLPQALHQGLAVLQQGPRPVTHTANSLTALFLPQANEALLTYWQRVEQRLYNLRHNLSLDGQPLALPIYAAPADPAKLHSAAVASALGTPELPTAYLPQWRFPLMLENARAMVNQLSQFGATLLSVRERQDAEALSALMHGQAKELMLLSIDIQNRTIAELDTEHESLTQARGGAQQRLDSFSHLYEENVNSGETAAMDLYMAASVVTTASTGLHMASAALEMVPNIYGLAVGGARYGALLNAVAIGSQLASSAMQTSAAKIGQSEMYRRRRQEWEIQRNNAYAEVAQLDAQLQGNALRREAALMQKDYLATQQQHTQALLAFLQGKFSNQALYSWMNGRLSALYFQLYDLAAGRCLMAEQSYRYVTQDTASFIKQGVWQSSYAGLLSGEILQLGLAQMDDAYLRWDSRALEVTRTISLADVYAAMPTNPFDLDAKIDELLTAGTGSAGTATSGISVNSGKLLVFITLSDLGIRDDYPSDMQLGDVRRIKQISVSLPALVGPYQDIQAALTHGGSTSMPKGCNALAVSHGLNDSGQFQLDFNDGRFLPFEGLAIDDSGLLTLTFPNATTKQNAMLMSLSDVIMHIRYTIRSVT